MSDNSVEVTDRSAFSEGSLAIQVVLAIVTLGLYTLYWWYSANQQLAEGTSADNNPALRTVGLLIPFYNFVVMWRTAHDSEAVTDQSGVILFVLLLVFAPAAWFLIQSGINDVASGAGA
jgi:hypothetical protein